MPRGIRKQNRILLVEDERPVRELVAAAVLGAGCEVASHQRSRSAGVGRFVQTDLALIDVSLPTGSGWLVGAKLKFSYPGLKLAFLIDKAGDEDRRLAKFLCTSSILNKPLTAAKVLESLGGRPASRYAQLAGQLRWPPPAAD